MEGRQTIAIKLSGMVATINCQLIVPYLWSKLRLGFFQKNIARHVYRLSGI